MTGCFCPQLLMPHVRYTIAINTKAREELICEHGIFDKVGLMRMFSKIRSKTLNRKVQNDGRQKKGPESRGPTLKVITRSCFFLPLYCSGKRNRRRWPRPAGPESHQVRHLQDPVLPGQHQGSRPGQDGRGAHLLLQRRRLQSVGSHQEVMVFFHSSMLRLYWLSSHIRGRILGHQSRLPFPRHDLYALCIRACRRKPRVCLKEVNKRPR